MVPGPPTRATRRAAYEAGAEAPGALRVLRSDRKLRIAFGCRAEARRIAFGCRAEARRIALDRAFGDESGELWSITGAPQDKSNHHLVRCVASSLGAPDSDPNT